MRRVRFESYPGQHRGSHRSDHGEEVEGEETGDFREVFFVDEEIRVGHFDICKMQIQ